MKYALEDLLRVRAHRQDDAEAELTRKRKAEADMRQALADRKREREEYIAWRINEEKRLWDELIRRKLTTMPELDDLKATIAYLREQELAYDKKISDAETAVVAAAKETLAAQESARRAMKERQKIEEHKELWKADEKKEEEASAEKEMEDFRVHSVTKVLEEEELEESTL